MIEFLTGYPGFGTTENTYWAKGRDELIRRYSQSRGVYALT